MKPRLDHPTISRVKEALDDMKLRATEFRGDTTLVADPSDAHRLLRFLRDDPTCNYDLLCDVTAVDYLNYPAPTKALRPPLSACKKLTLSIRYAFGFTSPISEAP